VKNSGFFGHCWPLLAIVGHSWPFLAILGHCWPFLTMSVLAIVQNTAKNGQEWPGMAKNCQKWPRMAKNMNFCTILVDFG